MNAIALARRHPRRSSLRDAFKSCLLLAVLLANLAGLLAMAMGTGDPQRIALGMLGISVLLVALP